MRVRSSNLARIVFVSIKFLFGMSETPLNAFEWAHVDNQVDKKQKNNKKIFLKRDKIT